MRPAARVQAAIDLLDEIIDAVRHQGAAADTILKRYFRDRRYAGSKDRRAIRDLVYDTIRRYGQPPHSGRAALAGMAREDTEFAALFDGSDYGPAPLAPNETGALPTDLPAWLIEAFAGVVDKSDIASLTGRAPLDIRVNLGRTSRDEVMAAIDGAEPGMLSPSAVRLPQGYPIEQHPLWKSGLVEIQDEGSQYVVDLCGAGSGQTMVDLCAGAGGKTLALYDRIKGEGRLIACDTDRTRLSRLEPRAERAGITTIETRLLDAKQERSQLKDLKDGADLVLIDAPCSGTGTWRRNPEARWRLTPETIERYVHAQRRLLEIGSELVKPGGNLVYVVCSLLGAEGEGQIARFLQSRSEFSKVEADSVAAAPSGDGYILTPARHDTDGFFFARLHRSC